MSDRAPAAAPAGSELVESAALALAAALAAPEAGIDLADRASRTSAAVARADAMQGELSKSSSRNHSSQPGCASTASRFSRGPSTVQHDPFVTVGSIHPLVYR